MLSLLLIACASASIYTALAEHVRPSSRQKGDEKDHSQKSYHHDEHNSICNKYTASILGSNDPVDQRLLVTLFVNTALVGNYTTPNVGVAVNGIIWPGEWDGEPVELMPWFNGELASSNPCPQDCGHGVSVNWLDSGGPEALRQNLTSFEQGTNQFFFVTHLHQYFGYLLDCSDFGTSFDRYNGSTNMYHIHKYMAYNNAQEQYTNQQFYLSAKSLGFEEQDARRVWKMLNHLFSKRCEPPKPIPKWAHPAPQSICTNYNCPLPEHAVCELYDPIIEPQPANLSANEAILTCGRGIRYAGTCDNS